MGAAHSRRGAGAKLGKDTAPITKLAKHQATHYFILCNRGDKIKVVNIQSSELKVLKGIIIRHYQILKEGWNRHLTFSFKLKQVAGRHSKIQLIADILLSFYQLGWEPMTPIENKDRGAKHGTQVTVCFQRKEDSGQFGSSHSILSESETTCLCVETYKSNFLGFHSVSNTLLYEIVTNIQKDWKSGIKGVSMGISSVICDYTDNMPPVLQCHDQGISREKYILLEGHPWTSPDDSAEIIQMCIVACLTKEGYKLSMDIHLGDTSRVFFFIKDKDQNNSEVNLPNKAGAGLGEKETLSVYRPMVVRSKSSFLRSYHGRTNSIRLKVRASLRRKTRVQQGNRIEDSSNVGERAMTYKVMGKEPAWWQQTSTEMSSDVSEDERANNR